ncbi:MAG: hypothetical protein GX142_04410 [Chloroflexi bacterium]|jgi:very-short-patch-repair endonuclease|nr:hypothetical protein [Chloroflexota bacterium]
MEILLEEMIAASRQKFIACGGYGVLDWRIALDEIEYDYDKILKEIICQT